MNRKQRRAAMRQATPNPISEAQLNANRANAQHSCGPKTEAGRAASSQNRLTHGLARHNGAFTVLKHEDPAAFQSLKTSLEATHQPVDDQEVDLVNNMAEALWLSNRAQNLQNDCMDPNTGHITDPQMFDRLLRYETHHTRTFHKCLNDLLNRRAERRKIENGFEAQKRKDEELRLKTSQENRKKEFHQWDLFLKDAELWRQVTQNVRQYNQSVKEDPGFEAQFDAILKKHGLEPAQYKQAAG